jgi:Ca2+-binding RTX toxin-like protein
MKMGKRILTLGVAVAATLAMVGTANAAVIVGTQGDDNLFGTRSADFIRARGGDDVVRALRGDDTLRGQLGDDALVGGRNNDLVNGGFGNDELWGGNASFPVFNRVPDIFNCGPGFDTVRDFGRDVDSIVGPGGEEVVIFGDGPIAFSETCEVIRVLEEPYTV